MTGDFLTLECAPSGQTGPVHPILWRRQPHLIHRMILEGDPYDMSKTVLRSSYTDQNKNRIEPNIPRAPGPSPQVRWYSTPQAATRTIFETVLLGALYLYQTVKTTNIQKPSRTVDHPYERV